MSSWQTLLILLTVCLNRYAGTYPTANTLSIPRIIKIAHWYHYILNEYVHQCKINYPPKSKLERIDTLKLSQVELNHANFCFVQARGYSYKPNKSLMFGFLLSPVCVHWQCNDSHTCINRTCLSMCLCVYINAYQIRYSTKPLDWACIMQQVNLAKASI